MSKVNFYKEMANRLINSLLIYYESKDDYNLIMDLISTAPYRLKSKMLFDVYRENMSVIVELLYEYGFTIEGEKIFSLPPRRL